MNCRLCVKVFKLCSAGKLCEINDCATHSDTYGYRQLAEDTAVVWASNSQIEDVGTPIYQHVGGHVAPVVLVLPQPAGEQAETTACSAAAD